MNSINKTKDINIKRISINIFKNLFTVRNGIITILEKCESGEFKKDELYEEMKKLEDRINPDYSKNKSEIKKILYRIVEDKIVEPISYLKSLTEINDEKIFVENVEAITNLNNRRILENLLNELDSDNFNSDKLENILYFIEYMEHIINSINSISKNFIENYEHKQISGTNIIEEISEEILEKTFHEAVEQNNEAKGLLQKYRGAQLRYLPTELIEKTESLLNKSKTFRNTNPKLSCEYAKMAFEIAKITVSLYENPNIYSELMRGRI